VACDRLVAVADTLGVGGQDSCDLVLCPGFENADHMHKQFCPVGGQQSAGCFTAQEESSEQILHMAVEMERVAEAGADAWDAWLVAGGEKRRHLDARYTRIKRDLVDEQSPSAAAEAVAFA
jgi:hypothetical protein